MTKEEWLHERVINDKRTVAKLKEDHNWFINNPHKVGSITPYADEKGLPLTNSQVTHYIWLAKSGYVRDLDGALYTNKDKYPDLVI